MRTVLTLALLFGCDWAYAQTVGVNTDSGAPVIEITAPTGAGSASVAPQSSLLSIPGVADFVAKYGKQCKVVGRVDLDGKLGTGMFLPLRRLKDSEGNSYAAAGFGGVIRQGGHFQPKAYALLDASSIFRRMEKKWTWYDKHTEKVTLPDFWLGPDIGFPSPGDKVTFGDFKLMRTWLPYLGISVAISL